MNIRIAKALLPLSFFAFHVFGQQAKAQDGAYQNNAPVVARVQMKLALKNDGVDVIEKGDLLTVLEQREESYVIQTFSGNRGVVSKANALPMEKAVSIYDDLIRRERGEGRLYTMRASAQWAAGKPEEALADYDQAIELGYDAAHAFASRGLFHAAMQNHESAIADFNAALERKKDDVSLINRAAVYMTMQQYAKAVQDYSAALELQPENAVLHTQLAVAHKMLGQFEEAIKDYERALKLSPENVSAWMGRGYLYYQQQQYEKAVADFTKATEIAPQSAVAFNNRGYNLQLLGRHAEAFKDFVRAVELAPRYLLALQNKAWALTIAPNEQLRNADLAIETAKRVCELSDYKDVSDLTLLAAAHASAGEFEAAIEWQEKAIEYATDQQALVSQRILELYQQELPLDPKLLDEK